MKKSQHRHKTRRAYKKLQLRLRTKRYAMAAAIVSAHGSMLERLCQSSMADMPTEDIADGEYKLNLSSPYGTPESIVANVHGPLAMLMLKPRDLKRELLKFGVRIATDEDV